jgi:hypothetical protein
MALAMNVELKIDEERAACSVHDSAVMSPRHSLSSEYFCIVIHESVI